ncbi:IS3 family transposase [Rugamonas sp. CCM 8940]|uniref:IS3 family transposase n=1 Tax=Rugamonas sp. CCM 8940 TaxID=2765359 RepID=UPI003616A2F1
MKHYSAERKEAILRQMMPPTNKLVSELAREHGIAAQTLYTWRRNLKDQGVPVPGNGKNAEEWSSKDKFGVVLETAGLSELELAEYCRRKGIFVEQIAAWRNACQEANAHSAERSRDQREQGKTDRKRIKQLEKELLRKEKALAEAAALIILRKKGPGDLGGSRGRLTGTPDRQVAMDLIEQAAGSGCRRAAACAELDISLRTYQRWTREDGAGQDGRKSAQRPAPANKLSEAERAAILVVVNSPEFASQPPSQIVPTLVDRGQYLASESTIYRVMKEAAQQHHRGRAKKPSTRVVTSHCATEPNRLWSWDITWLPTAVKGLYFYWYMVLDVYSRKIVGHEVHVAESADLAALLMRRASLNEGLAGRQVVLHSDNGSAMKGATMLATLEKLGIMPSFSRPRVSNDNPFAESLFRTCKYRPNYPRKPFESVEQARAWTQQFVQWYNHQHKHSGLKFVTPAQRHGGQADAILRHREQVYEAAKQRCPERWSGATRDWKLKDEVWLNPERAEPELVKLAA